MRATLHCGRRSSALRREATDARAAVQITALTEDAHSLERLFARLAHDHSRAVHRLAEGAYHRPSPLPTSRQRQLQQHAAFVDRTCRLERRTYGSLLPKPHRYPIVGTAGPIDLRARRDDLVRTFFVQRFAYDRDGSVVRAQQGQVVIDVNADTALYFADRVGPGGEVHAIEPDVRCAAVIRENGLQNPHLGYQTVVSVRVVSDRVRRVEELPVDGTLRIADASRVMGALPGADADHQRH